MADTAAGRAGAVDRSAVTIDMVPGHAIRITNVNEKLAALDALPMQRVLAAAKGVWAGTWGREGRVNVEHFEGGETYGRYRAAQARKDWDESDRLCLGEIVKDCAKYRRLLNAEETAYAFSAWLWGTALTADHVYRWIDPAELESCASGTFESKIEADGTRRGFKALTVNPRLWFDGRKIRMRVPMNGAMRKGIRCVRYTVLPRDIDGKDERVGDPKEIRHADESEIRVPDGTPIPQETDFAVLQGATVSRETIKALGATYRITGID